MGISESIHFSYSLDHTSYFFFLDWYFIIFRLRVVDFVVAHTFSFCLYIVFGLLFLVAPFLFMWVNGWKVDNLFFLLTIFPYQFLANFQSCFSRIKSVMCETWNSVIISFMSEPSLIFYVAHENTFQLILILYHLMCNVFSCLL
jgi:hypothetical protein